MRFFLSRTDYENLIYCRNCQNAAINKIKHCFNKTVILVELDRHHCTVSNYIYKLDGI
jgi:hypothetical protein